MRFRSPSHAHLHFIPDTITCFNLFTGFLSILSVSRGEIHVAAWLIVLCLVWDSLDGNISRLFKNPTQLGRELDSLADIVSFVVAPAFIAAGLLLNKIGPLSLFIIFLYLTAGAYRLARFNIHPPIKDYFEGLPTPAAAIILSMTTLACLKNGLTDLSRFPLLVLSFLPVLSFLMVSKIRYPKLSAIPFSKWQSLLYITLAFLGILSVKFNTETGLASSTLVFLLISPLYAPAESSKKSLLKENLDSGNTVSQ